MMEPAKDRMRNNVSEPLDVEQRGTFSGQDWEQQPPRGVNDGGRNLLHYFERFAQHRELESGETGNIAARPRQACDQAGSDRIA
jgi:hypothetical protein